MELLQKCLTDESRQLFSQKISIIDFRLGCINKYTCDYLLALAALEVAHFPLIGFLHD